jgi:bacillolysin
LRPVLPLLLAFLASSAGLAAESRVVRVAAVAPRDLAQWDARIDAMLQSGALRPRQVVADTLIPGRQHQRLEQLFGGVPVFGGEIVRQASALGTVSVFGTLYEGIAPDPRPALSPDQARAVVERLAGAPLGPGRVPELTVLPLDAGGYALTYRLRAVTGGDLVAYFIDARTGALVAHWSELETAAAVGLGKGVLGDTKKISTSAQAGGFVADDALRPPALRTFDMKGDVARTIYFLNGVLELDDADLAFDSDDDWTDGADVDAHVYAGYVYDYYFKRFGRRGLDDADIAVRSLVHPVKREDIGRYQANIVDLFYLNAGYFGHGVMVYGEGLAPDSTDEFGQHWNYLAGGLDVVAHELSHGVTEFTSRLSYRAESGALNEAFSDIMGTSVEFYFQPPGSGPLMAEYLIGEDVITPGGIRSLEDPARFGNPDHYSKLYVGPQDNGGVHINSTIPSHAFYLAIEGGTNRTSGIAVRGVGGSQRDQMEKVFYRAFAFLLPSTADFATARAVTLQSARDLYGSGSPAEAALAQAWTAVGVM